MSKPFRVRHGQAWCDCCRILSIQIIAYRAYAETTGGRDGRAISSDGVLDIALPPPKAVPAARGY